MVRNIAKTLVGWIKPPSPPGRDFWPYKDDVFLVSYPKSGNTWMRFLLANLLYSDAGPITFDNIAHYVPDIYMAMPADLQAMKHPRIVKSHEYFEPRYQTVIYLVRDPRDVAVSYYHHLIRVNRFDEQQGIAEFVRAYTRGTIDMFGSWGENVGSWLGARQHDPRFLLLRYEDLLQDTAQGLAKIASLLGRTVDNSKLVSVVETCRPDNLRRLEKSRDWQAEPLKTTRRDMDFIRSAKAGEGKAKLPEESIGLIKRAWGPIMAELGYQ